MTVIRRIHGRPARRGATTVEAAAVLSVFILFVLGIFEYGRFAMVQNLLVNAAREGCRYAVAHNSETGATAAVQAQVRYCMFGLDSQVAGFQVQVFPTNNPSATLDTAGPDEPITVRASGTFSIMFPTLMVLPSTVPLSSSSTMICEGN